MIGLSIPEELTRILKYEDLSKGQIVYVRSRATHLVYECEILKLKPATIGDLKIRLTDDAYKKYQEDGATGGQTWYRNFVSSLFYLYNDQNNISFWKGK